MMNVSQPPELSYAEEGKRARDTSMMEDFSVGKPILTSDV